MSNQNDIVAPHEVLALMLRRFLIDFPCKSSKRKIKELYAAWVYHTSSIAAPHEHADMLIFTEQLKALLRQADKMLNKKE